MKNNIIKPSILPGFMELLPTEQVIFNDIVNKITKVYDAAGFLPIDTPIIEKAEVLLAKSAGETEKQVYKFNKGDKELALRFDLTGPFARYVAQYNNDINFPFKRYQIGKVYRGEKNQKGRYREFYQFDLDVIGNGKLSVYNDALVISLVAKAFKEIGLTDYKFQINNRKIMSGIMEYLKIVDISSVMILIDKYDKIGEAAFEEEVKSLICEEKAKTLIEILNFKGDNDEIIEFLLSLGKNDEVFDKGVEELQIVINTLKALGVKNNNYVINLKIIRGLDYYTGTVFETLLVGNESYGSVCSGGRYYNLTSNYSDKVMPGVGISIGVTRLFFILKEIGFIDTYQLDSKEEILIIPIGDTMVYCMEVYRILQEKGKKVSMYLEDDKLKKKLTYANKIGANKVVFVGEEESVEGMIKVKDMITGEVKRISKELL